MEDIPEGGASIKALRSDSSEQIQSSRLLSCQSGWREPSLRGEGAGRDSDERGGGGL